MVPQVAMRKQREARPPVRVVTNRPSH